MSENKIILKLLDEDENVNKYELIDVIEYDGKEYAVLLQPNETEVEIYRMKHNDKKTKTMYEVETDRYIANQVYLMLKNKMNR